MIYRAVRFSLLSIPTFAGAVLAVLAVQTKSLETFTSVNFQIHFSSQRFLIERATLLPYRRQRGLFQPLVANGHTTSDTQTPDASSRPPTVVVVDNAATVTLDRAGAIEGLLFEIRVRRLADDTTFSVPIARFSHDVSERDWRLGVTVVGLDSYKEVRIRVRDKEGHPASGEMIGLSQRQLEGGIDFRVDENGEAALLLLSGSYTAGVAAAALRFEVLDVDKVQIFELSAGP